MAGEKHRGAPKRNVKKPSKAAKLKEARKLGVRPSPSSTEQTSSTS